MRNRYLCIASSLLVAATLVAPAVFAQALAQAYPEAAAAFAEGMEL